MEKTCECVSVELVVEVGKGMKYHREGDVIVLPSQELREPNTREKPQHNAYQCQHRERDNESNGFGTLILLSQNGKYFWRNLLDHVACHTSLHEVFRKATTPRRYSAVPQYPYTTSHIYARYDRRDRTYPQAKV
jgi:hypothetical protein